MTPRWKFNDVPNAENPRPPFYEQPWPPDLPDNCQICGTKFRTGFNITHGPGKAGRMLRKIAYVGFLPCLFLGPFVTSLIPGIYDGLRGSQEWWLFFGSMFIPPMALAGLSCLMPNSRHLECKKCGWSHDYKPLKFHTEDLLAKHP